MPNQYKYIDLSYLESISEGNTDIVNELITIFIEQVPEFTDGFDEGFTHKDWSKIAAVAHKAKSSVMSMGINNLGNNDLKNLELLAKQLRVDELITLDDTSIKKVEELEKLRKNLDSYPKDRKNWILQNKNELKVKELIDIFNTTCTEAIKELNQVLDN